MNQFVHCFVTRDLHSLGEFAHFLQRKFPFRNHRKQQHKPVGPANRSRANPSTTPWFFLNSSRGLYRHPYDSGDLAPLSPRCTNRKPLIFGFPVVSSTASHSTQPA